MSQNKNARLIERARKASTAVYLATEEGVAADLSSMLTELCDALTAAEAEREALKNGTTCGYCDFDRSLSAQLAKLEAENAELKQKFETQTHNLNVFNKDWTTLTEKLSKAEKALEGIEAEIPKAGPVIGPIYYGEIAKILIDWRAALAELRGEK